MITVNQLKPYRINSDDYSETERLKALSLVSQAITG